MSWWAWPPGELSSAGLACPQSMQAWATTGTGSSLSVESDVQMMMIHFFSHQHHCYFSHDLNIIQIKYDDPQRPWVMEILYYTVTDFK